MTTAPDLACVRICHGLDLAQIYKSKLEAMGIPVLLRYESAGLVYGITVDGLGEVRVMVPRPYADEATALLEDEEGPFPGMEDEQEEEEGESDG
jgi:hypothetical protein